MTVDGMTIAEKLLVAAHRLEERGNGPMSAMSAEDLVVAAWREFPRAFGLRGYEKEAGLPAYPDSNRVYAELMGSKPLLKRGYLRRVGKKLYALTASGRARAKELSHSATDDARAKTPGGKATMPREMRSRLERLLGSRAVRRAQDGELPRITFHDACVFWGITSSSSAVELEGALADVEAAIRTAEASISSGASELRTGEANLSQNTTDLLRSVSQYLRDRFSEELETIKDRSPT